MTRYLVDVYPVPAGPPGQPPSIWNPVFPSNPIAGMGPGGNFPPPLGIWGGGGVGNYPDAGFPGPQPGGPVYPSHPIYRPDLGFWGGSSPGVLPQPYPDQSLPGNQPYPDQSLPGQQPRPSHPIYYPPYPTTGPGFPTPPIVIPIPPNTPGAPPEGGMVAIIPAGTTIVSTQDIEIANPADPDNPFIIPSGTVIVTSQPILVPTGYAPPGQQPPVATPQT